jgi:tripartite-type tricarboxylate transporter receptor subunit TctC
MAGRVDLQLDPSFAIYRHVKGGKMKAIAVTGAKRDAFAPEVPTVAETLPGFSVLSINGIVVSGRTPRDLVQRINADFGKLLQDPDVAKRLAELGIEPVGNSPEDFASFIRSEIARWTRVAKAANVKME